MTQAFYITAKDTVGGMWYQLITTKTHFCISCGSDLDTRLRVLKDCVKRHRTEQRLLDSLSRLDCGGKVSPATFAQREEYYREHGKDYDSLVLEVVEEALRELREEDKAKNPLRKTRTRLQKAGWPMKACASQMESLQVDLTPTPTILRKPRVFNRK